MQSGKTGENKPITIYDIAKEAQVSPATVSRVLTNSAKVRPEKRDKVLALIAKYNFKPNAMAKGLADTKSKIIGIISADIRNPFYAELFVCCEQAAKEAGYTVMLSNCMSDTAQEEWLLAGETGGCYHPDRRQSGRSSFQYGICGKSKPDHEYHSGGNHGKVRRHQMSHGPYRQYEGHGAFAGSPF